jgi:D-serine deaminase-like pyridoxal phosphate-dependent protein
MHGPQKAHGVGFRAKVKTSDSVMRAAMQIRAGKGVAGLQPLASSKACTKHWVDSLFQFKATQSLSTAEFITAAEPD